MKEQTAGRVVETTPLPNEDPATLVELETLLEKHDFWLGFSPIKGWVLLDRKHPRYTDWDRPLILLRDGSIELLSREEFRNEPQGPWALRFWKRLDGATRSLSGPASTKLPEVRRHIEEAVGLRKVKAERAIDCDEDLESRIGEPPFRPEHYLANNIESQEMRAAARRAHYAEALPRRIQWLRGMAGRIQSGSTGPEPAWSKGKAAATHLRENGIDHLWHFTDARNLDGIRREGGLLSRAGLLACGINDAHLVASDYSRSCDEHCGRERYVRMSFIPNSWFFHRVRRQSGLVWLRFSLGTLAVGEVLYSRGNAASPSVTLQPYLHSMGVDWDLTKKFSGAHSDERGPIVYEDYYQKEGDDPMYLDRTRLVLNSEILIEHFVPFEYCTGIFDCRTGDRIPVQ